MKASVSHVTAYRGQVPALEDISLTFPEGSFTSILGSSSSGKFMLLTLLAGLDVPSSGTIVVDDFVVSEANDRERAVFRRDNISYIRERGNLMNNQTVRHNIELPARLARRKLDTEAFGQAVELLRIGALLDRTPAELTLAECGRVALARALTNKARLLLYYEPTTNLGESSGCEAMSFIRTVWREFGITTILATQGITEAATAQNAIIMSDGRIAGRVSAPTPHAIIAALEATV